MILLNGHTLEPAMKFMPESLGVNLEERKSTATMQIGPDAPGLAVGDWLRDETAGCGQGVIWRVKSIDTNYNTDTRLVTMEHIINTLRDAVLFGETTPADITGDPDATTCSAEAAIEYILDRQDLWELASDFPYLSANAYKFNGDTLYAAIESVTGTLEDPCWWYDLSAIPFKLHITEISDEVSCEMREGRNIQTLKKTIDRSRMYTRFYPIGKDNLQLSGDGYISKNESTYGMVAKVETNQKYETEEELEAWAWTRLERHCFPTVTISIGGEDLSRQTGESLDALTLGRKCRVPLPEFGTTIVERIIRISASDKIKEPDRVTVTMGNELQDIASIINEVIEEQESGSGGGGRGGMKKQGEDHAWFVDTDDHVGMIAEAIIGRGADGVDWSRVASIIVDGYGIHQRVVRAEGYLVTLEARIDLDEEALRAEFDNFAYSMRSELELSAASLRIEFENGDASLRSELQMSAASLRVEFTNEAASLRSELQMSAASLRVEFTNEAASLRSEFTVTAASLRSEFADESASVRSLISQEAGRIDLVVTGTGSGATVNAANIALAINQSTGTGEVHIDADHVYINAGGSNEKNVVTEIGGKLVTSDITTTLIKGVIEDIDIVIANALSVEGGINAEGTITSGGVTTLLDGLKFGYTGNKITNCIVSAELEDNDTKLKLTDAAGTVVTFERAASVSGNWSGTVFTATAAATSGAATAQTSVHLQVEGAANPNATVYAKVYKDNPSVAANQLDAVEMTLANDVSNKKVTLSANNLTKGSVSTAATYNAGWDYGQTQRVRTTGAPGTSEVIIKTLDYDEKFKITDTYTKSDGTTFNTTYTLKAPGDNSAAGRAGGWSAAYGKVVWPSAGTGASITVKAPAANETDNPNQQTKTYNLTVDGYYAYIKDGATVVAKAVDHHDIGYNQWSKSGAADTMVVCAYCQPNGTDTAPGGEGAAREYKLTYSNGYAYITRGNTNYASLQCGSGGVTGLTRFKNASGNFVPISMQWNNNGSWQSAGRHYWYWKD